MDPDTLQTASRYVNNLLIARGLLRSAKPLDFARPSRETRAHTINLVHDLLLRGDRDRELREQSAFTIQTLRSDLSRRDAETKRLHEQLACKDRTIHQARTETSNATTETRRLEASHKKLQEQLQKMKATLVHLKTQCAADLRKRDIQMERLKSHLQGQQRGNKSHVIAPSMTISGGSGVSMMAARLPLTASPIRNLDDPEYSLKQETNDFLTRLSASLSDENDNLINLLQSSLQDLKQLLSLERQDTRPCGESGTSNVEDLGQEMTRIRDTLRELLTSPSFVAVEEVEARDEEIARLREGWEMMESRWQDVLGMMDVWRQKMERSGETIDLDELKQGLGLGMELESITKTFTPRRKRRASSELGVGPEGCYRPTDSSRPPSKDSAISGMAGHEGMSDVRALLTPELRAPSHEAKSKRCLRSTRSSNRRFVSPLQRTSGQSTKRSEVGDLAKGRDEKENMAIRVQSSAGLELSSSPPFGSSDGPTEPDLPILSVLEKLKVAEREAAMAVITPGERREDSGPVTLETADDSLLVLRARSARRSGVTGRPRRRKSTLSPEELESLLGLE